jgi:3-hydroxyacyl-CoA dehydrogenase
MAIRAIAVIGAGTMGRGIAQLAATATVKAVERAGGNLATAVDVRAALVEIGATGSERTAGALRARDARLRT